MRDKAFHHTEKSSQYRKLKKVSRLLAAILLLSACVRTIAFAAPVSGGEPSAAFEGGVGAFESQWSVGNTVTFGAYEQDNRKANGKEAIQWRVLAREDDRALLISFDILDSRAYNRRSADITWEKSTLRTWLNQDFLNAAFTRAEREAILTTEVMNEDHPTRGTDGGKDTSDKVFLLSSAEAENLFRDGEDRSAKSSAYAIGQGLYTSDNGVISQGVYSSDNATGWWWLRSPGDYGGVAAFVDFDGSVLLRGTFVEYDSFGVRPAFWLDLTAGIVISAAP